MSKLDLSKERFDATAGGLLKTCNDEIIGEVSSAVKNVLETGDNNAYIDTLSENFKTYSNGYNGIMGCIDVIIGDFKTLADIDEYIKRDNIGDVDAKEISLDSGSIVNPFEV